MNNFAQLSLLVIIAEFLAVGAARIQLNEEGECHYAGNQEEYVAVNKSVLTGAGVFSTEFSLESCALSCVEADPDYKILGVYFNPNSGVSPRVLECRCVKEDLPGSSTRSECPYPCRTTPGKWCVVNHWGDARMLIQKFNVIEDEASTAISMDDVTMVTVAMAASEASDTNRFCWILINTLAMFSVCCYHGYS